MPAALLAALILAALGAAAFGSVRTSFTVLVGTTLLVPDSLVFPYGISSYLIVQRLVLVAALLRLLLGLWRGDVVPGAFRATPAHLALALFAAVAYVDGVLLADWTIRPVVAFNGWLLVADQLLFLVVAMAAIRMIGDPAVAARRIVAIAGAAALIAIAEHVTKVPYAVKVFFDELPEQAGAQAARAIERRGGDVRVRAAAGFALSFAWVLAALVPLSVAVASWNRRRWLLVPVLAVPAILWTYSRSALVGLAIGGLVLVVASRFQGLPTRVVIAGAIVGAIVLAGTSTLGRTFDEASGGGSDAVRTERIPVVLEAMADRPLTGGGIGTVRSVGFLGTDAAYLQVYADLGVLGLTALGAALAAGLWVTAAGLRTPYGADRTLSAATVAGVVCSVIGAGAFDLFPSTHSARPFWLLVALGAVVAEAGGQRWALQFRPRRALVAAMVGLAAGVGVFALAPTTDTAVYWFQTLGVASDSQAAGSLDFIGRTRYRTACDILDELEHHAAAPDVIVDCTPVPFGYDLAQVRLAVPHGEPLAPAIELARDTLVAVLGDVDAALVSATSSARPAWATTATVWAPVTCVTLALLAPRWRRAR